MRPKKKSMPSQKNQHSVPQCYLREFIDPETPLRFEPFVWIFDKNGKTKKRKAPKNILKSNNLYTINVKGKTKDYSIEKALSSIENDFAILFRQKIKNLLPLTETEHISLCLFVATMLQRTVRQKVNFEQFIDELISHGEQLAAYHGIQSKNIENLKNYRKDAHKLNILGMLPDITQILLNMSLAFLVADGRKSRFITSDDPCTLFNPKLHRQRLFGPGLGQKDVELIMPLSPKIALCLSWSNFRGYIEIGNRQIEELNRLTRAHCFKSFISSSSRKKLRWFSKYPFSLTFTLKIIGKKFYSKISKKFQE